jgi:hypothetical protein
MGERGGQKKRERERGGERGKGEKGEKGLTF